MQRQARPNASNAHGRAERARPGWTSPAQGVAPFGCWHAWDPYAPLRPCLCGEAAGQPACAREERDPARRLAQAGADSPDLARQGALPARAGIGGRVAHPGTPPAPAAGPPPAPPPLRFVGSDGQT
ncbi:hypothetical protein GGI02_001354 [Coemansia sp. RSA 2322]|uniref:Uncharacterized protein n=1 Tax=Coemansia thaxteri TaxID=2663907 RepID=A0A9W8BDC5_9FUNG|nr:hypothetical protein H4R26_002194 [Coemansia thaxteri]KAJ2472769.1 hypothetical protein GGI02_001354 [Coemansia sp. RSA 2322]KAJ2478196.1 hypothetical protein EV174_004391 [Coemansia sp. RSA 2320]